LQLEKIDKTFNQGTATENHALKQVSLEVNEGDYVSVIGGNGAGKSTVLNAIAGAFLPDSGEIYIQGASVTRLPEHKRAEYLGRVFQDPMMGTASDMTIGENLALALHRGERRGLSKGLSKAEKDYFYKELKTLDLGLENRIEDRIGLLSGGQRQAITLLMSTIKKPKLLLLDEHTAALDPKTAAKVLKLTDDIVAQGKLTALMITHNLKDAIAHGNRLIMMNDGRIVFDVSGDEKKALTVEYLLEKFSQSYSEEIFTDSILLA
ncbi:MAG: ABC transporter ATP-binding protein, partial [Oscillospiraceae bacterium]